MGLLCEFTITEDLGYPNEVFGEVGGQNVSVYVDYSQAAQVFVSTFLRVAGELVPVRTGYLRSTISANTDGDFCQAEAAADYAQYVEYGTVYMDAQPYFEPALLAALEEASIEAQEAYDVAQEELEVILEELAAAASEAAGASGSEVDATGFMGGLAMTIALSIILFPVLLLAYGIADTIGNALTGGGGYAELNGLGWMPEVVIT